MGKLKDLTIMFEIRENYLTEHKVLMSDERANRPLLFKSGGKYVEDDRSACPFCIENRHELSGITEISEDGRIIVLPNKYPAIGEGNGYHEVIIDTNRHGEEFAAFSVKDMARAFKTLFSRYEAMYDSNSDIKYVQILKNDGHGSGASIAHSHWQSVSMPFVPKKQALIHSKFEKYYSENKRSYIEHLFDKKELIICENDYAFAYMPHAAPYGYSINIAPIRHVPEASMLKDEETEKMAAVFKASIQALRTQLNWFPYNICFQHPPKGSFPSSHFYMELIPRLENFAGLEIGADVYINSHFPEITAAVIKKHIKSH